MKPRPIRPGVHWLGAIDWNRRLFDSLIPLPDGTSYNTYLVQGAAKTALLDTVTSKSNSSIRCCAKVCQTRKPSRRSRRWPTRFRQNTQCCNGRHQGLILLAPRGTSVPRFRLRRVTRRGSGDPPEAKTGMMRMIKPGAVQAFASAET